jgi:ABC-type Mn2+/Zn2+ transport system ATPase subunit
MIALSDVCKQYGRRILLVDASFQLNPGEKVGLVGPNGAGKTTVFRMIAGEESPDAGEVSVPKRTTVGYFRQDVESMSGRPVLDEAIAGSGRLGDLHHELIELEGKMGDPDCAGEMDAILARFGEVQHEYQERGGYELEARAREVLHGLGFEDRMIDGDVGALSGGWKMRVAMAKVLLGGFDVLLMDEPTNHLGHRVDPLARAVHPVHARGGADDLPRPRFHESRRGPRRGHRRRRADLVLRRLRFLRARAGPARNAARSRLLTPAGDAGQGAALHRTFRGPRRQGGPGAEPREEA